MPSFLLPLAAAGTVVSRVESTLAKHRSTVVSTSSSMYSYPWAVDAFCCFVSHHCKGQKALNSFARLLVRSRAQPGQVPIILPSLNLVSKNMPEPIDSPVPAPPLNCLLRDAKHCQIEITRPLTEVQWRPE